MECSSWCKMVYQLISKQQTIGTRWSNKLQVVRLGFQTGWLANQPMTSLDQFKKTKNKKNKYQLKLDFLVVCMLESKSCDELIFTSKTHHPFFREHKHTTDWNVRAESMNYCISRSQNYGSSTCSDDMTHLQACDVAYLNFQAVSWWMPACLQRLLVILLCPAGQFSYGLVNVCCVLKPWFV